LFNGTLSTYEQLGFVRDRKIGKHRWVFRTRGSQLRRSRAAPVSIASKPGMPTGRQQEGVTPMSDKTDRAGGKVKETAGRVTGDSDLEAEGRRDQIKGNVKESGKKLKDAAKKL
jgi:uncharacterized protein YjbJ (UPF0337 family)